MEHDIIARVYPYADDQKASRAIESNRRCAPPLLAQTQNENQHYSRRERESTAPLENSVTSALDTLPSLLVRLGDVPRTNKGLIFGANENCDIVLRNPAVSSIHFSITFDECNRLIVKDLNSLRGTQVTYNGDGQGVRRNFRWIVGGHRMMKTMTSIIITIPSIMSFQIVVPFHELGSRAYIDGVNRFRQGAATAEGLLDTLGLSLPSTRPITGANTPGTGAIHLTKTLGQGSFGVVIHIWDVSTGEDRVVKKPSLRAIQTRRFNEEAWRREARIMGQISSPHIVQLLDASFTPYPQLVLEYMQFGSLEDQEDLSYNETLTVLTQCLSGLEYLHEFATPIAHRDIKPANILVDLKGIDMICVKLADFGLSQDKIDLQTMCGTKLYLAPEIYPDFWRSIRKQPRLGYTTAVDVWSLGVVACELYYGLPTCEDDSYESGVAWCQEITASVRDALEGTRDVLGHTMLSTMLVLNPDQRCSARVCKEQILRIPPSSSEQATPSSSAWGVSARGTAVQGVSARGASAQGASSRGASARGTYVQGTPARGPSARGSSAQEEQQATPRYTLRSQSRRAGGLSTAVYKPRSTQKVDSSRFARSGAPAPKPMSSSRVAQDGSRLDSHHQNESTESSRLMRALRQPKQT